MSDRLTPLELAWLAWLERPQLPGVCRVCGAELTISRLGGGHPTVYNCGSEAARFLDGRKGPAERAAAAEHYRRSEVTIAHHGNPDVRRLIAEVRERREAAGEPAYPEVGEMYDPYGGAKPDPSWRYIGDDRFEFSVAEVRDT
jgi:hypothetical protein